MFSYRESNVARARSYSEAVNPKRSIRSASRIIPFMASIAPLSLPKAIRVNASLVLETKKSPSKIAPAMKGASGDAVVKHDTDNLSHIVIDGPVDSSSHFAGHGVVFHIDIHPGVCGFFVFVECKDGLFVIGYGVVDTFCRVFGHFDFTEQFFDLSFHFVGIEVTDNDNTLLVGAIPFVIVVA